MEAIVRGSDEMVTLLVSSGADPNLQDRDGFSALHFAAQDYKLSAAQMLLRTGAKVDLRDSYGNTPLSRAVFNSRGRGDMIKLLLQHGADPLVKNNHEVSPLDLANTIANYDVKQFFSNV